MRFRAWPAAVTVLLAAACTNDYESFRFPRQPSGSNPAPEAGTGGTGADAPSTPPPTPTSTAEPDARPPDVSDASSEGGNAVPEAAPPVVPEGGAEAGPRDAAFDVTNG